MGSSGAVITTISLTLIAGCFATDASRNRITFRKYRTNYRVDSWDDNRDDPYRVTFWKFGLKSVYTFDVSGNIKTLTARDVKYSFDTEVGTRMLVDMDDDAVTDIEVDPSEIPCSDCSVTWNTLCDGGIADVCYLDINPYDTFDEDALDSVRRMCSGFGAACASSALDACDGQCTGAFPETSPAPVPDASSAPTSEFRPSPTPEPNTATKPGPVQVPSYEPTPAGTPEPVQSQSYEPTASPTNEFSSHPTFEPTTAPTSGTITAPTSHPTTALTLAPVQEPTFEPTETSTPEPTPGPSIEQNGACNPNHCENEGSCSIDPAGGHVCSCASNFGGMACQTDTSSLNEFFIELVFNGTWTSARQAVFQAAADRWAEVISHVPCGGTMSFPAGRLLITSVLKEIDGEGSTLGTAGPRSIWKECPTITAVGEMTVDIDDINGMEEDGTLEGVVLHEMGHVIGIGTLWGAGFGECTTCSTSGDPAWTCPAALSVFSDIGGTDADIVELDGVTGTSCSHLDENMFADELMTGFVDSMMYLSKMTAAILDDLNYVVDPSAVDEYILPSVRGVSIRAKESEPSAGINDTATATTIILLDDKGDVVDEKVGVMMEF